MDGTPARRATRYVTWIPSRRAVSQPRHGPGPHTTFAWTDLTVERHEAASDGAFGLAFTVRNTGTREGTELVQLYLHDPVASVVQPVQRLIGYVRLELTPGQAVRVHATVPADLAAFTGRDGRRIVEPGELELRFGASSTDPRLTSRVGLTGPVREVDHLRRLHAEFRTEPIARSSVPKG